MAASPVSVANMALTRLGGRSIASLGEGSRESILASTFFEPSRDAVLREYMWTFASRRRVLAQVASSLTGTGWGYVYGYPADCLAVRRLQNSTSDGEHIPYEVTSDANGTRVILTDQAEAVLVYTARHTDLSRCDPLFIEALSWKLASEMAVPLTQDRGLAKMAFDQYRMVLSQAQTVDANEGRPRPGGVAEWLKARGV